MSLTITQLAISINTSTDKGKSLLLESLRKHDTLTLCRLCYLGIRFVYLDTLLLLLSNFPFLIIWPFVFLFSSPVEYARIIPAERWRPINCNSGLAYSNNNISSLLNAKIPFMNIQMSDFRALDDNYYLGALALQLHYAPFEEEGKNVEAVNNIKLKNPECQILNYLLRELDIDIKEMTLGEKIQSLTEACQMDPDNYCLLLSLMLAKKIPETIIALIITTGGPIVYISLCRKVFLKTAYGYIPPQKTPQINNIVGTFVSEFYNFFNTYKATLNFRACFFTVIVGKSSLVLAKATVATAIFLTNPKISAYLPRKLQSLSSRELFNHMKIISEAIKDMKQDHSANLEPLTPLPLHNEGAAGPSHG